MQLFQRTPLTHILPSLMYPKQKCFISHPDYTEFVNPQKIPIYERITRWSIPLVIKIPKTKYIAVF